MRTLGKTPVRLKIVARATPYSLIEGIGVSRNLPELFPSLGDVIPRPSAHQASGSHKMPNRHTARTNRRAAHESTRGAHESTRRRARIDTVRWCTYPGLRSY